MAIADAAAAPPASPRTPSSFRRTALAGAGTAVLGPAGPPPTRAPPPRQPPAQDAVPAPATLEDLNNLTESSSGIASGGKTGDGKSLASAPASPPAAAGAWTDASAPPPPSPRAPHVVPGASPAPAPPRWRFVDEARKSRGYSSADAGACVAGTTSDELGAKYVAPDISLFRHRRSMPEVRDLEYELPPTTPLAKDDVEVGKLEMRRAARDEATPPSPGVFPGLPKPGTEAAAGSPRRFREWEATAEIAPKEGRERPWQGGVDVQDSYAVPGEEAARGNARQGVGKIQFGGTGSITEAFSGEFSKRHQTHGLEDADSYGEPREGALFLRGAGSQPTQEKDRDDPVLTTDRAENVDARKRRCLFLLLLLPLLLGISLAAVLARTEDGDVPAVAGVVGGVLLPPVVVANVTAVPSSYPSSSPTLASTPPSVTQSASPSRHPTTNPTCRLAEINLCLAVDMSGSVCNGDSGSDCLGCRTSLLQSFLPMFFPPECRDASVSEDTCCANFAAVKDFATLLVDALGGDVVSAAASQAETSFSVVEFATDARLVSARSPAGRTQAVIDGLDYAGGLTNHAAALARCRDGLLAAPGAAASAALPWDDPRGGSSDRNRRDVLVLVTDGAPTVPEADPEGAAAAAARRAEEDGIAVVPVFIAPDNDAAARAFMRRLSSDGTVFDATDFGGLNALRDRLVTQVSCA